MTDLHIVCIAAEELSRWEQLPQDAGQMVTIHYALAADHEMLVCRTVDRSRGMATYECAELDYDGDCTYEPWNGILPATYGGWEMCEIVD